LTRCGQSQNAGHPSVPPPVRGSTILAWSFTTKFGTALDAADVRRDFRTAMRGAEGINPKDWTPRELRHSFVSLLSDNGLPIDEIARLVGHSSSAATELVYRQQIRPVVQSGAVIMDRIFDVNEDS
jgi:integrase